MNSDSIRQFLNSSVLFAEDLRGKQTVGWSLADSPESKLEGTSGFLSLEPMNSIQVRKGERETQVPGATRF